MISKKKVPVFNFWEPLCASCQLIVELESDSAVNSFAQYLKNTVYALRLRKNGDYLERHDDFNKIPSFTFPQQINDSFESFEDISHYVYFKVPFNFEDSCGLLVTSTKNSQRKYVALSIPHFFSDGKYYVYLIDHFLNKKGENSLKGLPDFPNFFFEKYGALFSKGPTNIKDCIHDDKLTRFSTNDKANLRNTDYDEYQTIHYKLSDLKNKFLRNNVYSVSNYTELLYMSNYFAICAHENKLLKSYGINNIVDLRQFSKKPSTFANLFEISNISPFTDGITADMTVSEVGRNLRKSLIEKIENNEQFSNSREYNRKLPQLKGIYTEFTNIGAFHIKKPIKDLFVALCIKSNNRETVSNMGFSVVRDDFDSYTYDERLNKSQNDMVIRYRYSPMKLSFNESKKIVKCIEYFMKNISFDDKIGKAYDEIRRFYNSI
ncbi:hypothetical protein M9Y10_015522 [Tritrichomonas musculus]|uniref:Uncharacterized protein n=1 Tax=Tritrichomonas musculus TaxID=1915356 RepID=A0ABR2L2I4_9EUKA